MRKSLMVAILFFGLWMGVGAQTPEPVVITDLSWSPDGRYVAVGTGSWDESLSLCSYAGSTNIVLIDNINQRIKTIRREEFCTPVGISFSPDGSKLAIVTQNAEIWDIQLETRISGYTIAASFIGVSWNPSGESILISLDVGSEIYFTPADLINQKMLTQSDLPNPAWFTYGAWSGDGVQVATVTDDSRIHIWTPDQTTYDQTITLTFEGHTAPVKRLAWNPVSGLIASGDDAGNILIWDPQTGETVRHLTGHDGIVYDVAWSPDGQQLASAGADGTLRVWDGSTHRNKIIASGDIFTAVSYSPDGSELAYGGAVGEALELSDVAIIPAPMFEPIPTPTPPVSPSEGDQLRALFSGEDCALDCFMGIKPGVTTLSEMEMWLQEQNIEYTKLGDEGSFIIQFQPFLHNFSVAQDDIAVVFLDGVSIKFLMAFEAPVSAVYEVFGAPDLITDDNNVRSRYYMIYPKYGVFFTVSNIAYEGGTHALVIESSSIPSSNITNPPGEPVTQTCETYGVPPCIVPTATPTPTP